MTETPSCTIIGGGLIATAGALALEKAGQRVTVVTRAPPPLAANKIGWDYGDVTSDVAYRAVAGVETVMYAAGTLAPATQLEWVHGAIADEVIPVLKLAETAARTGAKTFVFISSGGTVYGPKAPVPTHETERTAPINMYGTIKSLTEQALLEAGRKYGITIVILRVSNPYGPAQSGTRRLGFIAAAVKAAIAREPIVIWGDGSTTRDFIYIDDVGEALAASAAYRGESVILNIGCGEERSLLDVCDIVSAHAVHALDVQFESGRFFDVPRSCLDITRARDTLGWMPRVNIDHGIREMFARNQAH